MGKLETRVLFPPSPPTPPQEEDVWLQLLMTFFFFFHREMEGDNKELPLQVGASTCGVFV